MQQIPTSVATGKGCAVCWRPFGGGGCMAQTLEGVTRLLCSGCASLFFPVSMKPSLDLPPGYEGAQLIHMDVSEIQRKSDEQRATEALREVPDNIPFLGPEQIERKITEIRGRLAVKDDVLHSAAGSALVLFREGFAADERELARLLALESKRDESAKGDLA